MLVRPSHELPTTAVSRDIVYAGSPGASPSTAYITRLARRAAVTFRLFRPTVPPTPTALGIWGCRLEKVSRPFRTAGDAVNVTAAPVTARTAPDCADSPLQVPGQCHRTVTGQCHRTVTGQPPDSVTGQSRDSVTGQSRDSVTRQSRDSVTGQSTGQCHRHRSHCPPGWNVTAASRSHSMTSHDTSRSRRWAGGGQGRRVAPVQGGRGATGGRSCRRQVKQSRVQCPETVHFGPTVFV